MSYTPDSGNFGTAPAGYVLLMGNDGQPAWMRPVSTDVLNALANSFGPTPVGFTNNGLLELGAPVAAGWSFVLNRLPVSAYRVNVEVPKIGYVLDGDTLAVLAYITATTNVTTPSNASTVLNHIHKWKLKAGDALRPLTLDLNYQATRALRSFIDAVSNTPVFTPTGTIFSDDFEAYSTDADLPQGSWTTAGNTGTGQQRIKTTFSITSPVNAFGTYVPHNGTKQLFLGNLSGTTLIPISGRRTASLVVNLTAVTDPAVQLTFWKQQIGNDTIAFDGFDLDVTVGVPTAQLIHEETSAGLGWVLKTVNLSAYIGQTITLRWSCYDDSSSGDPMAMLFDEVLIQSGATATVPPPAPGLIDEAYIEGTLLTQPLVSTLAPQSILGAAPTNKNIVSAGALIMLAYPEDLPSPPGYARMTNGPTVDMPFTLYASGIPVTNGFGVTKNYSVYLTGAVGGTGLRTFTVGGFPPITPYFASVIADLPYFYWRFDEVPNNLVARDSSGNLRDGTFVNLGGLDPTTSLITDTNNGSLFNGLNPNNSGVIRAVPALGPPAAPGDAFTMELWLRILGSPVDSGCSRGNVMGTETAVPVAGQFIAYFDGDNTTGSFKAGWSGGTMLTVPISNFSRGSSQSLPNHIVVVWSFTAIKVYVQGALVGSTTATPPVGPNYTTLGFPFCPLTGPGQDDLQSASIFDEAAFYTQELSAARVLVHYQNGIVPVVT